MVLPSCSNPQLLRQPPCQTGFQLVSHRVSGVLGSLVPPNGSAPSHEKGSGCRGNEGRHGSRSQVDCVDFNERAAYADQWMCRGVLRVVILARILLVLLTIRLLMPPGICICQLTSTASNYLANVLGTETPAPIEEDDDHAPGCPASILSTGMGVSPPAGPLVFPPAAQSAVCVLPCPSLSDLSWPFTLLSTGPPPSPDPLLQVLCVLMI